MPGELSKQFHKQTNFDFPPNALPSDPQYWPRSWSEIQHKEYPRMPKIELPTQFLDFGNLKEALNNRFSGREYDITKSLTEEELSTMLYYSSGIKIRKEDRLEKVRIFYPSGGALYPLEVYLAIQKVAGVNPGIYHYDVKRHFLEEISEGISELENIKENLLYPWSKDAAIIIFITAIWDRNFQKYNNRGYRITLMEAGHLAQNFLLSASALNIKNCSSVGFNNVGINEVLDISNEEEDSLYMILLGK